MAERSAPREVRQQPEIFCRRLTRACLVVRPVGYKISMVDDETVHAVRELRGRGLTPSEIARNLGLRPAVVKGLVRKLAAERDAVAPDIGIDCWINAGWRAGLTITGHPEWHDLGGDDGGGASGLVTVLVARRRLHRRTVTACVYLLDVYCLGVKNVIGPSNLDDQGQGRLIDRVFSRAYHAPPLSAPIELARDLVFGSLEYAHGLGFDPHPDFKGARAHLGRWTGPSAITFGCNGTPTYIEGPDDNPDHILRRLRRAA